MQPTTRRENESRMAARKSHPAWVQMAVTSATQASLDALPNQDFTTPTKFRPR